MAQEPISSLPAITSATLTDFAPFVQSGTTYKTTLSKIQTLFNITTTSNLQLNNVINAVQGNAATGTITLTVASPRTQIFTSGSGTATCVLPDATTLINGWQFEFNNNASGTITVQTNGGGTLFTMTPGSYCRAYLISNSFSAGQWGYHWLLPTSAVYGTAGLTVTGTIRATTSVSAPTYLATGASSGTISILTQAAAGTYNFNLPTTAGTAGYYLTSDGGGSGGGMTWSAPSAGVSGTANQILNTGGTLSFTDGISIGSVYQGTTPPTHGMIVSGLAGFGRSSLATYGQAQVDTFTPIALLVGGSMNQTSIDGRGYQAGMDLECIFAPTAGANLCMGTFVSPNISIPGGQSVNAIVSMYCSNQNYSNGGIVGTLYGFYFDGGASVPYVTQSFGGYFANPVTGTKTTALYADNLVVGISYAGTSAPTHGALFQGPVSIGANSTTPSAILSITSTTLGFLPPTMTASQMNAISSPANGLSVYNTTTTLPAFFNGNNWVPYGNPEPWTVSFCGGL